MPRITPFLWFDTQAEEAASHYVSIFPNSRIVHVSRYGEGGPGPKGTAMVVSFELDGQKVLALNGGPHFKFTEAISLVIDCETQDEVDHYWDRLLEGGTPSMCGWLKDKFGLSWQVTPTVMARTVGGSDPAGAKRAMAAMMTMKKIDIAAIEAAYAG